MSGWAAKQAKKAEWAEARVKAERLLAVFDDGGPTG